MKPVPTKDATHAYHAPRGWDPKKDGQCGVLSVRAQKYNGTDRDELISTWTPSPAELDMLNKGGVVILSVISSVQPPVAIWAEEAHLTKIIFNANRMTWP